MRVTLTELPLLLRKAPTMALTATAATDAAVKAAQDVPSLIANLNTIDPALGQQLTGKALLASKTPWGTIVGTAVGWGVAHFGLACTAAVTTACWSQSTDDVVTGALTLLGTLIGSYIMRAVTKAPISGLVTPASAPAKAAP